MPVRTPITLERFIDSSALPPVPDQVIRGGASVLQLQAACGFRAFAERRLFSTPVETAGMGLDPREAGDTVHVTLEALWTELRTQEALRSLSDEEREELLQHSIDAAFRRLKASGSSAWDEAYLEVQRQRLLRLLRPWLEVELARPPFTVALREKDRKDMPVGPLRLSIRADRVDTTEHGEVIVDYKTGLTNPKGWFGARPDEPQLPLYATLSGAQLEGILFAQIRAGEELGLKGYLAHENKQLVYNTRLDAVDLEEQVALWREVLTALAVAFHEGDASVRPKEYPTTCRYCQQRLLCRLDPASLEDVTETEAVDG